jgi:hypothetical protein
MSIRGQYQSNGSVGTVSFVTDTPFDCEFQLPAPGASQVLNRVTFTGASLIPVSATPLGGPGGNHIVADFRMVGEMWFNESPFPGRDGLDLFCYGVTDVGGLDFSDLTIRLDFNLGPDGSMVPGSRKITFEPDVLQVSATHGGAAIRPGSLLHSLPLRISGFAYAADGLTASATGAAVVHVQQLESSTPTAGSPQVPHASPSTDEQQSPYTTSTPIYALEYDLSLGSLGSLSNLHGGISAKLLLAWGPSPLIPDDDAAAVLVQSPQLGGGYGSFDLEGILKVVFGDANLLRVELDRGRAVYAILFNNIALSVLGYTFPPGILIDFMLFAGSPAAGQATNADNIAWFLSAQQEKAA